jgi:hypothetical protein
VNILLTAISLIVSANKLLEFDVGVHAGGNYQQHVVTCLYNEIDDGFSGHAGAELGLGFRIPSTSLIVGLESDVVYHPALYSIRITFNPPSDSFLIHYILINDLIVPVTLKAEYQPSENFRLGLGAGPCLLKTLFLYSWWKDIPSSFSKTSADSVLLYNRGIEVKADASFRIAGNLWLRPGLSYLLGKPDPDSIIFKTHRNVFLFSVGLVLKL